MFSNVLHKFNQVINHEVVFAGLKLDSNTSELTEIEQLTKVKEELVSINFVNKNSFRHKLKAILKIDENNYHIVCKSTYNYLIPLKNNNNFKNKAEDVVFGYLRQLYLLYTEVMEEHQNQSHFKSKEFNLILARYLNVTFMMAKWRYFNDQPAGLGVWENVHKVIKIAEELSLMNQKLFLYNFQNIEISLSAVLGRGFMLDTMQRENYSPLQIELADRIFKTWTLAPNITKKYIDDEYQFFIHLNGDERPQRIRGAKQHADFRYWSTTHIIKLVDNYLLAVDTRKSLDEFNLVTMAATDDIVQLFKKLRTDWGAKGHKRQRRQGPRSSQYNLINVSHGVDEIFSRICYLQNANASPIFNDGNTLNSLQLSDKRVQSRHFNSNVKLFDRENWPILEESNNGFSVELGKTISSWVKSGTLIGYATLDDNNLVKIAEIKSLRKIADGTYRAGLLKLAPNPISVKVYREQLNSMNSVENDYQVDGGVSQVSFSEAFSSLLIEAAERDKPRLIVPRHLYKRAARYKVVIDGEEHFALAGEVKNNHRDWICCEMIV